MKIGAMISTTQKLVAVHDHSSTAKSFFNLTVNFPTLPDRVICIGMKVFYAVGMAFIGIKDHDISVETRR